MVTSGHLMVITHIKCYVFLYKIGTKPGQLNDQTCSGVGLYMSHPPEHINIFNEIIKFKQVMSSNPLLTSKNTIFFFTKVD